MGKPFSQGSNVKMLKWMNMPTSWSAQATCSGVGLTIPSPSATGSGRAALQHRGQDHSADKQILFHAVFSFSCGLLSGRFSKPRTIVADGLRGSQIAIIDAEFRQTAFQRRDDLEPAAVDVRQGFVESAPAVARPEPPSHSLPSTRKVMIRGPPSTMIERW